MAVSQFDAVELLYIAEELAKTTNRLYRCRVEPAVAIQQIAEVTEQIVCLLLQLEDMGDNLPVPDMAKVLSLDSYKRKKTTIAGYTQRMVCKQLKAILEEALEFARFMLGILGGINELLLYYCMFFFAWESYELGY